jgi:hypothetical protein
MVTILPCLTAREKRQFERLPEVLHGSDPAYVPPFPGSIVKFLSPESPFQRTGGKIDPFLAWRDGRPVGRIAAILNPRHNSHHRDRTGFFGFFDAIDDPAVATELFAAAAQALRNRGCDVLRGPYNPSINDECGLLVEGFAVPPTFGLTWNPPYYQALVEGCGFRPVVRSRGFDLPLREATPSERVTRIAERAARRARVTLRPIRLDDLANELQIVREVYNATLERNTGFVPVSMDDLLGAAEEMRAIADPELILIAEMDGENAGVALTLPDFDEILIRIKRTPHWLRLPHILWLMKTTRRQSVRFVVYGISPRFRNAHGLHAWLIHEQFVRARERAPRAVLGWIEDNNEEILEACRLMGARPQFAWTIYEKPLA